MSEKLDQLAKAYGIATSYYGLDGQFHEVSDETKVSILAAMNVPAHDEDAIVASLAAVVHPVAAGEDEMHGIRCYEPEWFGKARTWGIAIQLYALRSARNWGIGDFVDLAAFTRTAAAHGADFIGTNPLHATFLSEPDRRSPFSPSNRRFLNPLYIAVDAIPGFTPEMADADAIAAARDTEFVDYAAVTRLKLDALRRLWPTWKAAGDLPYKYAHEPFQTFCDAQGQALHRHALFDVLSLQLVADGYYSNWDSWPEKYRSADSAEVKAFARDHADEIRFHMWLQWLASVQLLAARDAGHEARMRIGLYLDFAVGESPDGSATWGEPLLSMRGVHIGAPPDYFSTTGQDWALAPLSPAALMEDGIEAYRATVRESMRYAGALRVDHAMGLRQLFLIPAGRPAAEGTYVRYPMGRMAGALASVSHDCQTVLIGEDLGNVPEGFRDTMSAAAILSYRILYFERHDSGFAAPWDYPADAMACISTHDLPTFEGWWRGDDIRLRQQHDLIDPDSAGRQLEQRVHEREQLLAVLLPGDLLSQASADTALRLASDAASDLPVDLLVGLHRYIARTPSRLLAARIEDMGGEREPVNLPGTYMSYPNWQRKLRLPIEEIAETPLFGAIAKGLSAERPTRD